MSNTIFSVSRYDVVNQCDREQEVISWICLFADTYLDEICRIVNRRNKTDNPIAFKVKNSYDIEVGKKEISLVHNYLDVNDVKDNLYAVLRNSIRYGSMPSIIPNDMMPNTPTRKSIHYYAN